jgi:hypothetical protein
MKGSHIMAVQRSLINTKTNSNARTQQDNEFDGLYINVGVSIPCPTEEDPDATKFLRLNRGIFIGDLVEAAIYENTGEEWAAEKAVTNDVVAQIKAEALKLAEGEAMTIHLESQLYRKQEATEVKPSKSDNKALHATLFGK